ncbi:MAG: subtype B tannase, partial [Succiniclasticum sp.]|nr:subtype B tannase [Succiniclasticum sp.]
MLLNICNSKTKKVLAAAVFASLLQGVVIATPVFAEAVATSETASQETSTSEATVTQVPKQSKAKAADNTVALPDTTEQNEIDHSAEFKPVQNEFLKEGEGIPGSEVPYQNERSLSNEEWKTIDSLEKDIRILQREREEFFKNRAKEKEEKEKAFTNAFKNRQEYSIVFNPDDYSTKTMDANGEPVTFRAYEHLVYVKKPYDPESQMLSIYIPEAYLKGGTINGFTAETAPIFMPNGVGGYMPGQIEEPREESRHGGANAALYALSNGYVVVSPAIRGRSLKHENGYETGKAPALIVDYKAAVRFVRFNRKAGRIPAGDTEKIISSGTSAGGALSALLGATGNAKEYVPYLKEAGAAKERDDIFASMAYCPITNLENADMAYEWMFHNANEYYNAGPARRVPPAANSASPVCAVQDRPANAPAEAARGTAI